MFNAQKPSLDELPSSAQLIRSAIIAGVSAVTILVTVVLPAEYGIDPTRIGGVLGLSPDSSVNVVSSRQVSASCAWAAPTNKPETSFRRLDCSPTAWSIWRSASASSASWVLSSPISVTAEWKLVMEEGQAAEYRMLVEGGRENFDLHGHGGGQSVTYEKGRGSTGDEGEIVAAFDGEHGWFWRNRDDTASTVTVQVRGEYEEFKDAS